MAFVSLGLFVFGFYVLISRKYQVFGKQPVYGNDARLIGGLFLVSFVFYLFTLPFSMGTGVINNPGLLNMLNAIQIIAAIACLAILGYSAFFAPDATIKKEPIALSETVNTTIAAAYLQIPEQNVLELIHKGALQARKVGTDYRIHKEILIGYREALNGGVLPDALSEINKGNL
jgi:excisionase family DNA binding protein